MVNKRGAKPPERAELGRFGDRLSFLYAERCVVHRADNSITLTDEAGTTHVPAALLACLMLGPGTRISNAAISLLGTCGVTVIWVGERGVRYYAHGRSLSGSSRVAEQQAKLVSDRQSRVAVAREMYAMRFPDEDVSALTVAQLRGREGVRMRRRYREEAQRVGMAWTRRNYDPNDFDASDPANKALTVGTAALYGISHAAIVSVGAIPSLGFVHVGTERSFVFDIADLYKSELVLPLAFNIAASDVADIESAVRRALRDEIVRTRLLPRMASDILRLLRSANGDELQSESELFLWSEGGIVAAGRNYSEGEEG